MRVWFDLFPYLLRHRSSLAAGTLWLLLTTAFGLAIPWMLKLGVDAVEAGSFDGLSWAAGGLAGAALLRAGTRILSRHRFLHTARRIEVALRADLLAGLLVRDGNFFDRHRTGDLLSRFTNDLANVRMMSGFGLMILVNAALVYLATLAMLLSLSPLLTAVALLPYPLLLLLVKRMSRKLLHHSTRVQEDLGRVSEAVEEAVSGQAVIRAGALAASREQRFASLNDDYLESSLVLSRIRALVLPLMTVTGPLGTVLVLFYGGRQVIGGTFSLGELVAFNAYLTQLAWPTLLLGWVLTLAQRGAASLERLTPLRGEARQLTTAASSVPQGPPQVEVAGLSFAYEGRAVLSEVTFTAPPGTLVGVVGPTGSGKSTLLKLLAGLYPVPAGTVRIDGVDLGSLGSGVLSPGLAAVPQEGRLFTGTVAENLLYGAGEKDGWRLEEVSRQVGLAGELSSFPDGFETRVGEGGMSLSGGQRQRVCLGRALLRGGALWLLDDPFSHLDAETAHKVWEALRAELVGRTVFLVTARPSLLAEADQVLVLDGGRLVARGRHRELLSDGRGLYARLVEQERLREELEGGR